MDPPAVKLLCKLLKNSSKVLEFGSGGSTVFFSQFVAEWWAVEHDQRWGELIRQEIDRVDHKDRIALEVVEPDLPYHRKIGTNMMRTVNRNGRFKVGKYNDGTFKEFKSYITRPASYSRQFDIVINDGRARVGVASTVLREKLLVEGGVMMVHDWERMEYKVVLGLNRFRVWEEDLSGRRHSAFLVPYNYA